MESLPSQSTFDYGMTRRHFLRLTAVTVFLQLFLNTNPNYDSKVQVSKRLP